MAGRNGRTVHDLRRENRAALLQQLYFDGPLSRYELAPATGLSSGSVSNVVAELAAEGLVEEAGSVESDGGRPRTLLRIAPDCGLLIGVDVGENLVRVELFDLVLTELARVERPLAVRDRYDVDLVVSHIRDGIADVLAAAGADPDRLLGVGVGVPGIVARDHERGAVVHGQTIGWPAVPLEQLLRERCQLPDGIPYFIDNGAKTLGQAEMWFGAGRGAGSAVVVLFGSGVGACVVTEDGAEGRAVEWGHLTVRVRGRRCRCGALGCLEAYAGAQALVERWREAGGAPRGETGEEAALAELLEAGYGDGGSDTERALALSVLEETAEYLGAGLSDLINLFQPERILIGGWAGLRLGPRFLESVRRHLGTYALDYPLGRVDVALGRLGPDAVTVGAATLPLAGFFARGGRRAERARVQELAGWRRALVARKG
ncbi:ROK family transcriptional regulator [Streptomyces sp. SID14478]|uniref:ROK family transcriptional regulator n=1 Tax=Streptomyces sp. SID14478 TaxID=2706073 RepID=UPI0013E0A284|nr:ROK family transcriptional regulator [Streptomyces sp. SID14478]NEB81161.1 ROK family transcriptional regulator [Streptomyces sp. SID14478]